MTTLIHQEQLRDMVVLRSGAQTLSGNKTFANSISVSGGATLSGTVAVQHPISGEFLGGNLVNWISGHLSGSLDNRVTRFTTNAFGVGETLKLSGSAITGHIEIVGSGGIACIVNQSQRANQLVVGLDASGSDLTFDMTHPFSAARFSGQFGLTGSSRTSGSWLDYNTPLVWLSGGSQPMKANQGYFETDLYDGSISIRGGSKTLEDRSLQIFVYQENVAHTGQIEWMIGTSGDKNVNQRWRIISISGLDPSVDCPAGTTAAQQILFDLNPYSGVFFDEIYITGATGTDFYGDFKIIKDGWVQALIPMSGTDITGQIMVHDTTDPDDISTPSAGFVTLWVSGTDTICMKNSDGDVKQFATAS